MVTGIIKDSNKVHKRLVSVNPIAHHYEEPGEKPYIKWSCPVCETLGNKASIPRGTKNCPLCSVSLNWDRKLEVGDRVILRSSRDGFKAGDICTVIKKYDHDETCKVRHEEKGLHYIKMNQITLLDEAEDE